MRPQLCSSRHRRGLLRPSSALAFVPLAFALLALVAGCGSPAAGSPTGAPSPTPSGTTLSTTTPLPTPTPLRTPTAALPLRLKMYGDSVGGGLAWAMSMKAAAHPAIKLRIFYKPSVGLARPDYFSWPRHIREDLRHQRYGAAVFMSGANDAQGMTADGHDLAFGTKAWSAEYHRRVGALMDLFLAHRIERLYWVGMPHMASSTFGRLMKTINSVYQQEATKRAPYVVYVDSWRMLDGPDGAYRGSLRQPDGVHLASSGSFQLADDLYRIIEKEWHIR
jgi:uncharacterized protein